MPPKKSKDKDAVYSPSAPKCVMYPERGDDLPASVSKKYHNRQTGKWGNWSRPETEYPWYFTKSSPRGKSPHPSTASGRSNPDRTKKVRKYHRRSSKSPDRT